MAFDRSGIFSATSALFVDLYELTMLRAYAALGMREEAVFSLFVRRLPEGRNFLIACGLDELLAEIEQFRFTSDDISYLRSLELFPDDLLEELKHLRFSGEVFALAEGTPFFANEPIVEVRAPIGEAQLLETLIINRIGLQSLLASKAQRVVAAASGREVLDFGARRAQGYDAALRGARAFAIAGVGATSLVAAGARYNIPVAGTMAHSFVQAFESESEAFAAFAKIYPRTILLVDTYDTLRGVANAIELARRLGPDCHLTGVRLDSGDLDSLSRAARAMLDEAGFPQLRIVASGDLDEAKIDAMVKSGAPIDMFGVGTEMSVSADAPALDIAYKLTEYAGAGRMKLAPHKIALPGRKQVFRRERDGLAAGDVIARCDEICEGAPLIAPVMRNGERLAPPQTDLARLRDRTAAMIAKLPPEIRALAPAAKPYPVVISEKLSADAERLRARIMRVEGLAP